MYKYLFSMNVDNLEELLRRSIRIICSNKNINDFTLITNLGISLSKYNQIRPMLRKKYGHLVQINNQSGVWSYKGTELPKWIPTEAEIKQQIASSVYALTSEQQKQAEDEERAKSSSP